MRSIFSVALLVGAIACAGGGPPGNGGPGQAGDEQHEGEPDPAAVVELVEVARGDVADLLVTSATVESEAQADLFPVATGNVVSVHVDEGDPVEGGDVLAVVDNASLDAGAERASTELDKARRELTRVESLYEQGAVSERELSEARFALEQAQSSAREARRTHGQTRITAPFDGVVAVRDVRVGELASSGKRAFQVVDLDRLRVVAALPERDLSRVEVGQTARLVAAYDDEVWTAGTVDRIAPVVDPQSGTFRVTIGLDPDQTVLRPGQYVSVELVVDRHEGVVSIPRKALVYEDGVPIVYRMIPAPEGEADDEEGDDEEADGGGFAWSLPWGGDADSDTEASEEDQGPQHVAERVVLEIGLVDAERVEVLEGLEPGDQVVLVGQSTLKDGAPITTPALKAAREAEQSDADTTAGEPAPTADATGEEG